MESCCVDKEKSSAIRYEITGSAAHNRLSPLLPSTWVDIRPDARSSTSSARPETAEPPDFLWENAPRHETRAYRDTVKCYSHLPNGTAILDSKWVLARLFADEESSPRDGSEADPATLETHCFRGISGFRQFCDRVFVPTPSTRRPTTPRQFRDLLHPSKRPALDTSIDQDCLDLWVVKDASSNGAGGIWVVGPENATTLGDDKENTTSGLMEEHRYVAQRYAWPPVLYGGRKCHVRVYGLLTCDGRAWVHRRAFLHVANDPFTVDSGDASSGDTPFAPSVHITNCCANSHDHEKFKGEICADLEASEWGTTATGETVVPLSEFFP
jgi:Tubulin-tyrosine ligase family